MITVCHGRIGLVLHSSYDANNLPRRLSADREPMTKGVLRRAKSGRKSFIDDSNVGAGADFGFGEFPAAQNLCAHGPEISGQNRDQHGIVRSRTAIQTERPPDKRGCVERKEFGGTCGANSGKAADAVKHLLKIRELPFFQRCRTCRPRRRLRSRPGSHHSRGRYSSSGRTHGPGTPRREQNHREHYLRGYQALANQPRAARLTGAP